MDDFQLRPQTGRFKISNIGTTLFKGGSQSLLTSAVVPSPAAPAAAAGSWHVRFFCTLFQLPQIIPHLLRNLLLQREKNFVKLLVVFPFSLDLDPKQFTFI